MQHLATRVASEMAVHADRMEANLELTHGAIFSQRALTALVDSGMTRDDAYRLVQSAAQRAWDTGTPFRDLLAEQAPDLDLDAVLDYGAYLAHVPAVMARLDALRD
jgi:adenylosuccinate lyase